MQDDSRILFGMFFVSRVKFFLHTKRNRCKFVSPQAKVLLVGPID
jgi:hypothetical protein